MYLDLTKCYLDAQKVKALQKLKQKQANAEPRWTKQQKKKLRPNQLSFLLNVFILWLFAFSIL